MRDKYAQFIQKLSTAHLQCRTRGHSWEISKINQEGMHDIWIDHCRNECEVTRFQKTDRSGYIVSTYYEYPEGYEFTGHGYPDKGDRAFARRELMNRYTR